MVVESPWNPPKSLHKVGIGEECGSKELASDYQHLFKFIIIGDEASREESKKLGKGVPIGSSPWVPYQKSLGVWETETGVFSSSTTTISIISACRGGACFQAVGKTCLLLQFTDKRPPADSPAVFLVTTSEVFEVLSQ
jgi:hypothetical protein